MTTATEPTCRQCNRVCYRRFRLTSQDGSPAIAYSLKGLYCRDCAEAKLPQARARAAKREQDREDRGHRRAKAWAAWGESGHKPTTFTNRLGLQDAGLGEAAFVAWATASGYDIA